MKSEEWEGSSVCLCRHRSQGALGSAAGGKAGAGEPDPCLESGQQEGEAGEVLREMGGLGGQWRAEKLSMG